MNTTNEQLFNILERQHELYNDAYVWCVHLLLPSGQHVCHVLIVVYVPLMIRCALQSTIRELSHGAYVTIVDK